MADFNIGISQGGGGGFAAPSATPQISAPSSSGAATVSAIGDLAGIAMEGIEFLGEQKQKEKAEVKKAQGESLMREVHQEIKLKNIANKNGVSASKATANFRSKIDAMAAANPEHASSIYETVKMSGLYGGLKTLDEKAEVEQKKMAAADSAGYISEGMSDEERSQGLAKYEAWEQSHQRSLIATQKYKEDAARNAATLSSSKLAAHNAQKEYLLKSTDGFSQKWSNIAKQAQTDPKGAQESFLALKQQTQQTFSQAIQGDMLLGGDTLKVAQQAMTDSLTALEDIVTGKDKGDMAKKRADANINIMKGFFSDSKDIAATTALNNMTGNAAALTLGQFSTAADERLGSDDFKDFNLGVKRNMNPTSRAPSDIGYDPEAVNAGEHYTQTLTIMMKDKGVVNEAGVQAANFFKAGSMYGEGAKPRQVKKAVEVGASDSFATWLRNGGRVSPEMTRDMNNLVNKHYQPMLRQVISNELTTPISILKTDVNPDAKPTSLFDLTDSIELKNYVTLKGEGGRLVFDLKEGMKLPPSAFAQVKEGINELNDKLGAPLANMIKISTHAVGSDDYAGAVKAKADVFKRFFLGAEESPLTAEGSDATVQGGEGFGKRPDGSEKGSGFYGEVPLGNGSLMTEYSVGITVDGEQVDVPTLIPGLTKEEKAEVKAAAEENRFPSDKVIEKAAAFAKKRKKEGKSFFATEEEIGKQKW